MTHDSKSFSAVVKVLVVEEDLGQRELLAYNLVAEGWSIYQAGDGEAAVLMTKEVRPDAIILNSKLPIISGTDVCRSLKAQRAFKGIPIIMLCPRDEELGNPQASDIGADDYLSKPYTISDLVFRIRAHLRRVRPTVLCDTLVFENISLESETHRVWHNGNPVNLGPIDFRLLAILMERPGKIWSREALLERVWGNDNCVDTRTVDVYIGRLRKALGQTDSNYPLRTIQKAGYALG